MVTLISSAFLPCAWKNEEEEFLSPRPQAQKGWVSAKGLSGEVWGSQTVALGGNATPTAAVGLWGDGFLSGNALLSFKHEHVFM